MTTKAWSAPCATRHRLLRPGPCENLCGVLAQERLAQRRLCRLVAKADRRRNVAASGFVGEEHCARAQIGVVERFGERVHRGEADTQSRKVIHPFGQAALEKRPAQEIDDGLLMWAGAAQAERLQI